MKYLLDFDLTLMNTDHLKTVVRKDERDFLVGVPQFWEHYCAVDFLYDDVLPWLATKPKDSLHILTAFKPSQGPEAKKFQEAKISCADISTFVGSVTVMEGMKGPVAAEIATKFPPHEPIVFVDDILDQCLSVQESLPESFCFLIVRDGRVPPDISFDSPIMVVSNLAEVDAMMLKLL